MSRDAREWKKRLLRAHGVDVVEHGGDYGAAVAAGREEAQAAERSYFVDDENSRRLFLGYAVAALRLRDQLWARDIPVGHADPLYVYLPCGVGGAPGGITFGLKHVFGDHVHCFFAEPCEAPAVLVRMALGRGPASVFDIGLDNRTVADGLAVAQASELVYALVHELVDGIYTASDEQLLIALAALHERSGLRVEPSAAAAFTGLRLMRREESAGRLAGLDLDRGTHIFWTTGGRLVPDVEFFELLARGAALAAGAT
jgi:D-serine dehydratase